MDEKIAVLTDTNSGIKFIAEGQAKRLVDVICEFVSEDQASKIRHNAFLTDRVKTDNKGVMNNIAAINEAMSRHIDGEPHTPEKITFKYLKYAVGDMSKVDQIRRAPSMMDLKLRMIENPDDEYAGCMILENKKTIAFKVDFMSDLVKAMQTMETE